MRLTTRPKTRSESWNVTTTTTRTTKNSMIVDGLWTVVDSLGLNIFFTFIRRIFAAILSINPNNSQFAKKRKKEKKRKKKTSLRMIGKGSRTHARMCSCVRITAAVIHCRISDLSPGLDETGVVFPPPPPFSVSLLISFVLGTGSAFRSIRGRRGYADDSYISKEKWRNESSCVSYILTESIFLSLATWLFERKSMTFALSSTFFRI